MENRRPVGDRDGGLAEVALGETPRDLIVTVCSCEKCRKLGNGCFFLTCHRLGFVI